MEAVLIDRDMSHRSMQVGDNVTGVEIPELTARGLRKRIYDRTEQITATGAVVFVRSNPDTLDGTEPKCRLVTL